MTFRDIIEKNGVKKADKRGNFLFKKRRKQLSFSAQNYNLFSMSVRYRKAFLSKYFINKTLLLMSFFLNSWLFCAANKGWFCWKSCLLLWLTLKKRVLYVLIILTDGLGALLPLLLSSWRACKEMISIIVSHCAKIQWVGTNVVSICWNLQHSRCCSNIPIWWSWWCKNAPPKMLCFPPLSVLLVDLVQSTTLYKSHIAI